MPSPQFTAAWVLNSQVGIEGLNFFEQLPLLPMREDEILVKIHATSLNYRELMIAKVKYFPCPMYFSFRTKVLFRAGSDLHWAKKI